MGVPSKSQVESITDQIAAIIAADLAGYKSEYTSGKTVNALAVLVDGFGDQTLEAVLMPYALAVDAMSLPENHFTALADIVGKRTALQNFATALNNHVKSTAPGGGGFASLRAYLASVSGYCHPLYAELHRAVTDPDSFTSASVVGGVSVPTYSAIFANRVYRGTDGSLASELTDSMSAATADVTLLPSDDMALYIGCDRKFEQVIIALSTVATEDNTLTFQFWNGNAWATLTVTDNTVGLTRNDTITFTAPTDWTRHYKDAGGTAFAALEPLYYVRIARTADTVNTPAVGTCITVVPTYAPSATGASTHLGIQQPPLAICRISAANTIVVSTPVNVDYTRFCHPLSSQAKIRIRALTPISANVTLTLAYVDQAGANGSQAQSAMSTIAALNTAVVSLTNTTDGLRSVRSASSAATSATSGVFAIEVSEIRTPAP